MIGRRFKNKYFWRLVLSISAYSTTIVIVLSIVFSKIYSNNLFNQTVLILILCLFISYVISLMLYSPIKAITNMFKNSKYTKDVSFKDEFSLIAEVYKETIKDAKNLKQKNENYISKIKEDFLRKLLKNHQVPVNFEDKIKDYGINLDFTSLFIIVIELDYKKSNDDKNSNEIRIISGVKKLLQNDFKIEAVNMLSGEICLLMNALNEIYDDKKLAKRLVEVKKFIDSIPDIDASIGIGGQAECVEECSNVYEAALDMIRFKSVKKDKYCEIIENIKTYINDNYNDINLGVEVLAEKAGYTPNYFAKIFKNITGQYVMDYIKQIRIAKAKELLKKTNYTVNEISLKVGFINSTYFYSAFKKTVGITPKLYRNYKTIKTAN